MRKVLEEVESLDPQQVLLRFLRDTLWVDSLKIPELCLTINQRNMEKFKFVSLFNFGNIVNYVLTRVLLNFLKSLVNACIMGALIMTKILIYLCETVFKTPVHLLYFKKYFYTQRCPSHSLLEEVFEQFIFCPLEL